MRIYSYRIIRKVGILPGSKSIEYSVAQLTTIARRGRCSIRKLRLENLTSLAATGPRLLPSLAFRWSNAWSSQTNLALELWWSWKLELDVLPDLSLMAIAQPSCLAVHVSELPMFQVKTANALRVSPESSFLQPISLAHHSRAWGNIFIQTER